MGRKESNQTINKTAPNSCTIVKHSQHFDWGTSVTEYCFVIFVDSGSCMYIGGLGIWPGGCMIEREREKERERRELRRSRLFSQNHLSCRSLEAILEKMA